MKICLSILNNPIPPPQTQFLTQFEEMEKNENFNVRYRQVKLSNGAKTNVCYYQVSAIGVSAT